MSISGVSVTNGHTQPHLSCRACGAESETKPSRWGPVCKDARGCVSRMYAQILERRVRERE